MNKYEFIEILRKTLEVELPADKVKEHVSYYDEYINSMGNSKKQEEEIERIGDPHLIAKTIIDSFQDSIEYRYTRGANTNQYESQPNRDWYNETNNHVEEKQDKSIWLSIKRVGIVALVIFILIILLRFAFVLFLRIGIPVLVCYLIFQLIKKHTS